MLGIVRGYPACFFESRSFRDADILIKIGTGDRKMTILRTENLKKSGLEDKSGCVGLAQGDRSAVWADYCDDHP